MTVYQIITQRIVEHLQRGTVPWQQPWSGGIPRNLVSKRAYSGINVFLLVSQEYHSPWWLSFPNQVNALGGRLKQDEHTTMVIFWKPSPIENTGDGAGEKTSGKTIPLLRYYRVVNVEQCVGIAVPALETTTFAPIETCAQVITKMPEPPVIIHGASHASYRPSTDTISLPVPERFVNAEAYYSTLFHELAHATGHAKRLHRPTLTDLCPFGSSNYSQEELLAEMGAAFLCGYCGIANATVERSVAYIASWLRALQNDPRMGIHAASHAQKAADYILNLSRHEGVTEEVEHGEVALHR
jgi:antirestriction protein ArdC